MNSLTFTYSTLSGETYFQHLQRNCESRTSFLLFCVLFLYLFSIHSSFGGCHINEQNIFPIMRQYGCPYFGLFNFAQIKRKWHFYFYQHSLVPVPCALLVLDPVSYLCAP